MRRNLPVTAWIRSHWALIPVVLLGAAAAAVYLPAGGHARIAVSDNLDLFQSQYQMLRITGTFYAKDVSSLFLGGISRNVLPGEFSLTSFLYQIFPPLAAYELIYFVKVGIAVFSFSLLAWELDLRGMLKGPGAGGSCGAGGQACSTGAAATGAEGKASGTKGAAPGSGGKAHSEEARRGRETDGADDTLRWNLAVLCGLAYGMLNLFPSFGICFASIPLLVWLVLRLEREERRGRRVLWLLGIAAYPLLSYFSYFGIFLIAYLGIAFAVKSVRDSIRFRRLSPSLRLLAGAGALSAGYVTCEWRLFMQILFSEETTIRETMVQTDLSAGEMIRCILDVLVNGVDMHCESVHKWIVLPVCLGYLIILNAGCLKRGRLRAALGDVYNLAFLTLVFNSVVYGLYYCGAVRTLLETLLPPLKGFQFNRTAFFNPFLWYGMFFLALLRLALWLRGWTAERAGSGGRAVTAVPSLLGFLAMGVILFSGTTYNDLLATAKAQVKAVLGMEKDDSLDYAEFYSEELFSRILEEIDYGGEWAVAYGLHPAILNYSGIATLDGYLGFYSQEYKEAFREVIAPALEMNEATRIYYDDWGARCYLYSGSNTTVVEAVRHYTHTEETIDINQQALRELGCRYVFSRIHITNAEEKELELIGTFTDESSPYTIYVYEFAGQV